MMGTITCTETNIQCNENKLYTNAITSIGIERQNWRNTFTFKQAKNQCHTSTSNFTIAILQSGGLLCTLGAIIKSWLVTDMGYRNMSKTHELSPIMPTD